MRNEDDHLESVHARRKNLAEAKRHLAGSGHFSGVGPDQDRDSREVRERKGVECDVSSVTREMPSSPREGKVDKIVRGNEESEAAEIEKHLSFVKRSSADFPAKGKSEVINEIAISPPAEDLNEGKSLNRQRGERLDEMWSEHIWRTDRRNGGNRGKARGEKRKPASRGCVPTAKGTPSLRMRPCAQPATVEAGGICFSSGRRGQSGL